MTCFYIDKNFKLNEITLSIQYLPFLHTSKNIHETINAIIEDWGLHNKVYSITTDNGANVKRAILDMTDINWLGCSSHTLQLVIGKSMKSCKNLILRAKRLINFFLRPKQSEQLEEIQKLYQNKSNVV